MDLKIVVERLVAGDKDAEHEIIMEYMPLAEAVAKKFACRFRHKADDIYAQAYYGLCHGTHLAVTSLYDEHIVPYLYRMIWGSVKKFIDRDHLIPIEPTAFKKKVQAILEKDPNANPASFVPLILTYEEGDAYRDQNQNVASSSVTDWTRHADAFAIYDNPHFLYVDFLDHLKLTEQERRIVDLKVAGMRLREIGEVLGCSKQYVGKIVNDIRVKCKALDLHLIGQKSAQVVDPS